MVRFADFGATGWERLLFPVSDPGYGAIQGKAFTKREPCISGLWGLCRMGARASEHGSALLALAKEGRLFLDDGRYGLMTVRTLIRLGAHEAEVRELATLQDVAINASRLDRKIADARSEPDCPF